MRLELRTARKSEKGAREEVIDSSASEMRTSGKGCGSGEDRGDFSVSK